MNNLLKKQKKIEIHLYGDLSVYPNKDNIITTEDITVHGNLYLGHSLNKLGIFLFKIGLINYRAKK